MVTMIEITEDKFEELSENVEHVLRYGGKVMQCLESLKDKSRMGERMPDYRDEWRREREQWRNREDINSDWNYPDRYGERGGYHGGGRR